MKIETKAYFTCDPPNHITDNSECCIGGVSRLVPRRGLRELRPAWFRVLRALADRGYEPADGKADEGMREVQAGLLEMDIRPLTVTLYKSNGDSVYLGMYREVWDLGNDVEEGAFARDASAWATDSWWPTDGEQTRTTPDGLVAVATWDRFAGVRLLVEPDQLGGTAARYIGGSAALEGGDTFEQAWARYFANHPEVLASYGHQNGRMPRCGCSACTSQRRELLAEMTERSIALGLYDTPAPEVGDGDR